MSVMRVLKLDVTWGMALWWSWLLLGFFCSPVLGTPIFGGESMTAETWVASLRIVLMAGYSLSAVLFIVLDRVHPTLVTAPLDEALVIPTSALIVCAVFSSLAGVFFLLAELDVVGGAVALAVILLGAVACGCMMLVWVRLIASFGMRAAVIILGVSGIGGSALRLAIWALALAVPIAEGVCYAVIPWIMIALFWRAKEQPAPERGAMERLEPERSRISPIFIAYGFLYSMLYGLALTLEAHMGRSVPMAAVCSVGLACAGAILLVKALRTHATPLYRSALEAALVLMALAFVVLALARGDMGGAYASALLAVTGYIYFWLLYICVWIEIAVRANVRVLQVGAWGFVASAAAVIVGVALGCWALRIPGDIASHVTDACVLVGLLALIMNVFMSDSSIFADLGGMVELPPQTRMDELQDIVEGLASSRGFTPREGQIALLLARGRNPERIQDELGISVNTVRTHIRHIYEKCDVHSAQEFLDLVEDSGRR